MAEKAADCRTADGGCGREEQIAEWLVEDVAEKSTDCQTWDGRCGGRQQMADRRWALHFAVVRAVLRHMGGALLTLWG